jgi:ABC-type glycerol-3-phosphate transport system permease component
MNLRRASLTGFFQAVFKHGFLILLTILMLYPLYYMVITSLKTRVEWLGNQFGLPRAVTLANYVEVFLEGKLPLWFRNSITVTAGSVLLATLVSTLAAYAVVRFPFRGRMAFLNTMIALMVVPPSVLIVPLFILMARLKLINTLPGLSLIYVGLLIPFSIYLLVSFFRSLPRELFDAAAIDGCNNFSVLWRIVLPLSGPAFVTLVIVNSLYVWNELLLALVFLQGEDLKTLMPGLLMFKGHFFNNEAMVMSAAFLAALPMILLYLFGQRWFIEGLVAGSVK